MYDYGRLFNETVDEPSTASNNIGFLAIQRIGSVHCGTPSRYPVQMAKF